MCRTVQIMYSSTLHIRYLVGTFTGGTIQVLVGTHGANSSIRPRKASLAKSDCDKGAAVERVQRSVGTN
jgi:hypothetical protein